MKVRTVDFYRLREPLNPEDAHHRDLLRYDRGFVYTDGIPDFADGALVAFPTLIGPRGRGEYPMGPTFARWPRGFGLRSVTDRLDANHLHLRIAWELGTKWVTYRHPRNAEGAEDYTRLVPTTLREVLAARDFDEVALRPPCLNCGQPVRAEGNAWVHDETSATACRADMPNGPLARPNLGRKP